MTNAQVTDFCGINVLPGDPGYPTIGPGVKYGEGALVFNGVLKRNAITKPLDMSYGGTVNFHLKFAPIVKNEDDVLCKTAFGGDIHLSYCTNVTSVSKPDNQTEHTCVGNWVKFGSYVVYQYRYDYFSPISAELPEDGWSNNTMFMWNQPFFENKRDYWALDDINIFHRFDSNWRSKDAYSEMKAKGDEAIQVAQCCIETGEG